MRQLDALEGCLILDEISSARKYMKNQKTPGSDGFPTEFLTFWEGEFKYLVLRLLNHVYVSGQILSTIRQCQCVIFCLPKGHIPQQFFFKKWRVISLLSD